MKDWTPSALLHASGMYWESCAIHAAVHLDVFTPLSGGPMTVTELADRTGCVPQSLDRLLTALCAMGLLIRQGETCELPPFSRDHLCRGNPGYLGHIVEHHRHLMPGWSKLDESVRENRPTRHRSSVDTEDTGERESFLMGMYNIANAQAERSVPHIDLSGRSHLLDLGGATGAYAIHFCRRNPGLSATVFDLPPTPSLCGTRHRRLRHGRPDLPSRAGILPPKTFRRIRRGVALPRSCTARALTRSANIVRGRPRSPRSGRPPAHSGIHPRRQPQRTAASGAVRSQHACRNA